MAAEHAPRAGPSASRPRPRLKEEAGAAFPARERRTKTAALPDALAPRRSFSAAASVAVWPCDVVASNPRAKEEKGGESPVAYSSAPTKTEERLLRSGAALADAHTIRKRAERAERRACLAHSSVPRPTRPIRH